jgi:hypothetical protein
MTYICEHIDLIRRCIASSRNEEHLNICAFMIEDRIIFRGAFMDAELLFREILLRRCELLIQWYPIYEE